MSNNFEHAIFGGFGALLINGIVAKSEGRQITFPEAIGIGVTGAFFSVVPDILEAPTNPNHREFCHSMTVLCSLVAGGKSILSNQEIQTHQKTFAVSALAGYSSHLLLDSFTPKGLPLI